MKKRYLKMQKLLVCSFYFSFLLSLFSLPVCCMYLEEKSNGKSNGHTNGVYPSKVKQTQDPKFLDLSAREAFFEEDINGFSQNKYQKIDLGNSIHPKHVLAFVAQQTNLEDLNLNGRNPLLCLNSTNEQALTKETLELFGNLQNLKTLRLAFQNIGDEEMEIISTFFPSLQLLDISNTRVTNKSLKSLNKLKNLKFLIASNNILSDEGVQGLNPSSVSQLEELNLRGTKVSENILEHLQSFKSLKKADFRHTAFTSQWRVKLKGPETLEEIYLSVEEKEGFNALPLKIASMPHLKIVYEPSFNLSWNPRAVLLPGNTNNISAKDKYK